MSLSTTPNAPSKRSRNLLAIAALALGICGIAGYPALLVGSVVLARRESNPFLIGLAFCIIFPLSLIHGLIVRSMGKRASQRASRLGPGSVVIGTIIAIVAFVGWSFSTFAVLQSYQQRDEEVKRLLATNHLADLCHVCLSYASGDGRLPSNIATLIYAEPHEAWKLASLNDARMGTELMSPPAAASWQTIVSEIDAHCDYYFTAPGAHLLRSSPPTPSLEPAFGLGEFILFYDKAPDPQHRLIGFADGHVESYPQQLLQPLVDRNNGRRKEMGLPPLPSNLRGPPPAISASQAQR